MTKLGPHPFITSPRGKRCLVCRKGKDHVIHDPATLYRQARESAVKRQKPVLHKPGDVAEPVEGEATDEQIEEARKLLQEVTEQATKRRGQPFDKRR